MSIIRPFKGLRPKQGLERAMAAKPYDVLNSDEARIEKGENIYSFYRINKPEVDLDPSVSVYDDAVYEKAKENLELFINESWLKQDPNPCYYLYRQIMNGHSQVGLVCCSSIDDYFDDVIKKHEYTRPDKEADRIRHMDTLSAHVGPVFTCYKDVEEMNDLVAELTKTHPVCDIKTDDDVQHTVWMIDQASIVEQITNIFATQVPATYIADGHHRAASSAKVGQMRRDKNPDYTGEEEFNFYLSVLFPASQLSIIDYNRVVKDLNGHTKEQFLEALNQHFEVTRMGNNAYKPAQMHEFSMFLDKEWYRMTAKANSFNPNDPIEVLDVTILSSCVLDPLLGIKDQRTDKRIDFVGGIRGLSELENRVNSGENQLAFALYPVTIEQLMAVADSGRVMPPKTTWFEPKLRSGLVIHLF